MKKTWRRRNYFIKKELQGKYIFAFFLFVIVGSGVFAAILSMLTADTLTVVYKNYDLRIGKTPLILLREILSAHWIFVVLAGLVVVVLAMFFTHRLAGPLFRFERSVGEMVKGNFAFRIHLRKRDEGKELAESMNQLMDMISSNVQEMRRLSDEIGDRLSQAGSEKQDNVEATVKEAGTLNRRLREILYRFKLDNDE